MADSDDEVVIIDSSSASDAAPPHTDARFSSSEGDEGEEAFDYGDATAMQRAHTGAAPLPASKTQRSTAYDATCRLLHEKLQSLGARRAETGSQTDASVCGEDAEVLHHHLTQLDAALGIQVATPKAAPTEGYAALKKVAASWRAAARSLKRPRSDPQDALQGTPAELDGSADTPLEYKGVKQERTVDTDAARTPPSLVSAPAWADGVTTALEQCQRLLLSTAAGAAAMEVRHGDDAGVEASRRAHLAAEPHATSQRTTNPVDPLPSPSFSSTRPAATEAAPSRKSEGAPLRDVNGRAEAAPVSTDAAALSLLREAEVICAREHRRSLLPLYTELHALRRQNTQQQQQQAQTVSRELQWEQRLLADVLAECEAQLDFLHTNFVESCRGNLAPLEALQRRMQTLQTFQRQTRAAETATAPAAPATTAWQAADIHAEHRTPRPLGRAAEAVTRHAEAEQRRLQADLDAARAALAAAAQQHSDLQACYAHVTAELQRNLDAAHYVDRAAIVALKQQQREALAGLAAQLGWTLVNATADVLSLRHPGTGEVLHVNHTYGSINGRPCADVAKALAEYLVRHGTAAPSPAVAQAEPTAVGEARTDGSETSSLSTPAATPPCPPGELVPPALPPLPPSDDEEEEGRRDSAAAEAAYGAEHSGVPAAVKEEPAGAVTSVEPHEASPLSHPASSFLNLVHTEDSAVGDGAGVAADSQGDVVAHHDRADDGEGGEGIRVEPSADAEEEERSEAASGDEEAAEEATAPRDEEVAEEEPEEEPEEASEEFVNYSNLQSDATTDSHAHDSGTVNASTDSAVAGSPSTAKADVYTGFFTENALWDDDS